eukprot:354656-Chlamydomonas_euryale.AAC.9
MKHPPMRQNQAHSCGKSQRLAASHTQTTPRQRGAPCSGVERSAVWCGTPSNCVERPAVVWNALQSCGAPCSGVERFAVVWNALQRCGTPCSGVERPAAVCSEAAVRTWDSKKLANARLPTRGEPYVNDRTCACEYACAKAGGESAMRLVQQTTRDVSARAGRGPKEENGGEGEEGVSTEEDAGKGRGLGGDAEEG